MRLTLFGRLGLSTRATTGEEDFTVTVQNWRQRLDCIAKWQELIEIFNILSLQNFVACRDAAQMLGLA